MRELIRKLTNWMPEDEKPKPRFIEEEDFWAPGGWTDDRSHWDQYDEMPWNG